MVSTTISDVTMEDTICPPAVPLRAQEHVTTSASSDLAVGLHHDDSPANPETIDASELDTCWDQGSTPQPTSSYVPMGSFDDASDASRNERSSETNELHDDVFTSVPVASTTTASSFASQAPASAAVPSSLTVAKGDNSNSFTSANSTPAVPVEQATTAGSLPSSPICSTSLTPRQPSFNLGAAAALALEPQYGDSPDSLRMAPLPPSSTAPRGSRYDMKPSKPFSEAEPLSISSSSALSRSPSEAPGSVETTPSTRRQSFALEIERRTRSTPPRMNLTMHTTAAKAGKHSKASPQKNGSESEAELAPTSPRRGLTRAKGGKKAKGKAKSKAVAKPLTRSESTKSALTFTLEIPVASTSSLTTPREVDEPAATLNVPADMPSSSLSELSDSSMPPLLPSSSQLGSLPNSSQISIDAPSTAQQSAAQASQNFDASTSASTQLSMVMLMPSPPKKRIPRALLERQASLSHMTASASQNQEMAAPSSSTSSKIKRVSRARTKSSKEELSKPQAVVVEAPDAPSKRRRAATAKQPIRGETSSEEGEEEEEEGDDEADVDEKDETVKGSPKKKRRPASGSTTSPGKRRGSSGTLMAKAGKGKAKAIVKAQMKQEGESEDDEEKDEEMQDVERLPPTQLASSFNGRSLSMNTSFGYVLAAVAPRETEEQRRAVWNLLRLDKLVWTLVNAENGARFWWPADIIVALIKPPLPLRLLHDEHESILTFLPSGELKLDDPSHSNLLSFRTRGKVRFDKSIFVDPANPEDVKVPSVEAFESVLMEACELERKRGQEEDDDDDAADEDEVEEESTRKGMYKTKEQYERVKVVKGKGKSGGKKKAISETKASDEDEQLGGEASDDELLRAEDEAYGMTFPAIALAFASKQWWGCRLLSYTQPSSQGGQGYRAKGEFSVEFIDGDRRQLPRKHILLPSQSEFFAVKVGRSVLDVSPNYEGTLRTYVDQHQDRMQAIIDEEFSHAKYWNDEFFAGGGRRFQLSKEVRSGELTTEFIDAILDQIKKWASGNGQPRPTGSKRYEALNDADRSGYQADVLLPVVIQLITIEELEFRDDAKLILVEEEDVEDPTEEQIEHKAFELAREHLDNGSVMRTIDAIRAAKARR